MGKNVGSLFFGGNNICVVGIFSVVTYCSFMGVTFCFICEEWYWEQKQIQNYYVTDTMTLMLGFTGFITVTL